MTSTDWDQQYRQRIGAEPCIPRQWLINHASLLPSEGACFEAASGLGNNLPYLMGRGYRVFTADLSQVAVRYSKHIYPEVRVFRADLGNFTLPRNYFSLICHFYFLDWSLIDQYWQALVPGGVVVFETLTTDILKYKPDIDRDRLLQPGQLNTYFGDWDVLDYREGWFESEHGHEKAIASIIARKSGNR